MAAQAERIQGTPLYWSNGALWQHSIHEIIQGDFESGLLLADQLVRQYAGFERRVGTIRRAAAAVADRWERMAERLLARAKAVRENADRACSDFTSRQHLLEIRLGEFRRDFAADLPKRRKGLVLPSGEVAITEQKPKLEWAEDEVLLEVLAQAPPEIQEEAVRLKPQVNKAWLGKHVAFDEDGVPWVQVLINEETGELRRLQLVLHERLSDIGLQRTTMGAKLIPPDQLQKVVIRPLEDVPSPTDDDLPDEPNDEPAAEAA